MRCRFSALRCNVPHGLRVLQSGRKHSADGTATLVTGGHLGLSDHAAHATPPLLSCARASRRASNEHALATRGPRASKRSQTDHCACHGCDGMRMPRSASSLAKEACRQRVHAAFLRPPHVCVVETKRCVARKRHAFPTLDPEQAAVSSASSRVTCPFPLRHPINGCLWCAQSIEFDTRSVALGFAGREGASRSERHR